MGEVPLVENVPFVYDEDEIRHVVGKNKRVIVGFLVGQKFPFYSNRWVVSEVTAMARKMQPCSIYLAEPGQFEANFQEYPIFKVYQNGSLILTYKYKEQAQTGRSEKCGIFTCF